MTEYENEAVEPEDRDRDAQDRMAAVAQAVGVDVRRLQVLDEGVRRLVHLGSWAWFYKVHDTESSVSARVAIDDSGHAVDADDLIRDEERARYERYGVLQPALYDLLDGISSPPPDRRVPVLLRYAVEEDPI